MSILRGVDFTTIKYTRESAIQCRNCGQTLEIGWTPAWYLTLIPDMRGFWGYCSECFRLAQIEEALSK